MRKAVNRESQPGLLDQLGIGNGAAVFAQHPFDEGGFVEIEAGAECGDNGIDVHSEKFAPVGLPMSSSRSQTRTM